MPLGLVLLPEAPAVPAQNAAPTTSASSPNWIDALRKGIGAAVPVLQQLGVKVPNVPGMGAAQPVTVESQPIGIPVAQASATNNLLVLGGAAALGYFLFFRGRR